MRILADMADVKELKKAFKNDQDIHSLTASQVFNVDIKKVDHDYEKKSKSNKFWYYLWNITIWFSKTKSMYPTMKLYNFINAYFKKFPEIKDLYG